MRGTSGLLIMVLLALIIFIVLFLTTKFVLPNPQTVEESKTIEQNAQDAVNKYQQRNIQDQSIDITQ